MVAQAPKLCPAEPVRLNLKVSLGRPAAPQDFATSLEIIVPNTRFVFPILESITILFFVLMCFLIFFNSFISRDLSRLWFCF